MNERNGAVWPLICILLIGLPLAYGVSFGPACWLANRDIVSWRAIAKIFGPVVRCASDGPSWMRTIVENYSNADGGEWTLLQLETEIQSEELERRREAVGPQFKSRDELHWEEL